MKYFVIVISLFVYHCTNTSTNFSISKLKSKTIEYQYGESIYHVTFDTDSTLHWEAMAGDEKGVNGKEYFKAELVDAKLFITWSEENGIGVSQLLDLKNGIVYNHLIKGRNINGGNGKIRFLD